MWKTRRETLADARRLDGPQFIRWPRSMLMWATCYREALALLRPLMAKYLLDVRLSQMLRGWPVSG